MNAAALVLAAGRGERLGDYRPKGFVPLAGRPLLLHSLKVLACMDEFDRVIPVVSEHHLDHYWGSVAELSDWSPSARSKLADPVLGGEERQDSVRNGLAALPAGVEFVAVHDAARPLIRPAAVRRVLEAARSEGAAILAVPARDTIKRVRDEHVVETPTRAECWAAQTPQVFRVEILRGALAKAVDEPFVGTDDAEVVERAGIPVAVVEGDPDNLKVTWRTDLLVAEELLRMRGGKEPT